jgi:hypothetical protein
VLADFGLLERVGPATNSGLYAITKKGEVVAEHQDVYEDDSTDFEAFIQDRLDSSA